jgi:hypothetical protein
MDSPTSADQPYATRFLLLIGAVFGQVPLTLTSIIKGKPSFHWFSLGTLMSLLAIVLGVYNIFDYSMDFLDKLDKTLDGNKPGMVIKKNMAGIVAQFIAFTASSLTFIINIVDALIVTSRSGVLQADGFALTTSGYSEKKWDLLSLAWATVFMGLAATRAVAHMSVTVINGVEPSKTAIVCYIAPDLAHICPY